MDKSDTLKVSGALRLITALLCVVPLNNKRWYRINKLLVDSRPYGPSFQPGSEMSPQSSEEKTRPRQSVRRLAPRPPSVTSRPRVPFQCHAGPLEDFFPPHFVSMNLHGCQPTSSCLCSPVGTSTGWILSVELFFNHLLVHFLVIFLAAVDFSGSMLFFDLIQYKFLQSKGFIGFPETF